ncbi:MAG: HEAT repeat domain-containing protein [Fimbriimonas ginsengisoli]|uniref:HEAT repeat domain-containing protein n=1 Tax=Fimbriimonas ginsengisoli TaxID=1005039 RepID=A0A931LSY6_FIMGI|nr:HEAT repeat domain-containing protein [Fimbriimonas ginsengisoli]
MGGPKPLGDLVALHLADFGKEAADCVAPYLESANGEVRLRAAVALGLVGDSRGEPVLVEWLGDKGRSGFRRLLRGPPEALAKLADPALLPRLRAMLSDQEDHWLADRILQAYPSQLRNGK